MRHFQVDLECRPSRCMHGMHILASCQHVGLRITWLGPRATWFRPVRSCSTTYRIGPSENHGKPCRPQLKQLPACTCGWLMVGGLSIDLSVIRWQIVYGSCNSWRHAVTNILRSVLSVQTSITIRGRRLEKLRGFLVHCVQRCSYYGKPNTH